ETAERRQAVDQEADLIAPTSRVGAARRGRHSKIVDASHTARPIRLLRRSERRRVPRPSPRLGQTSGLLCVAGVRLLLDEFRTKELVDGALERGAPVVVFVDRARECNELFVELTGRLHVPQPILDLPQRRIYGLQGGSQFGERRRLWTQ